MHPHKGSKQQKKLDQRALRRWPKEVNVDRTRLMVIHDSVRFTDWYDLYPPRGKAEALGTNTLDLFEHKGQTPHSGFQESCGSRVSRSQTNTLRYVKPAM